VTATTHLATTQLSLADRHLPAGSPADLASLNKKMPEGVVLVTGLPDGERTKGISTDLLLWLRAFCLKHHLPLLVEADGSRQRPLKAPAAHEPLIPSFVDAVVVVAGLTGLGRPLDEAAVHRPEIFGQLGGLPFGANVTIDALARVLVHPGGELKNVPSRARRIALLNQADTADLQSQGRSLADRLLPAYEAVVIATLRNAGVLAVHEPAAGIVLAAGESRRFGQPKQLLDFQGQPFVRAVAQNALTAGLSPVIVVTGANADQIEAAIQGLPVEIVRNDNWAAGQSTSIQAGIGALPVAVGTALFLLADQPQIGPEVLRALVERHAAGLPPILAPLVADRRANPVLFDRTTFADLRSVHGDMGGRALFSKYPPAYLPWHDERLLIDVDTPEDYRRLCG